jgi:acetoin utilization deacetylase AcuC-like enzyme
MTRMVLDLCRDTGARLALIHEGGYSETYVPFCGHAVLEELSGSPAAAPDPIADIAARRQPGPAFDRFVEGVIAGMAEAL